MEEEKKQSIVIEIPPGSMKELVVGDKTYRSACDFGLTEADLAKSRRELNETESLRKAALLQLKSMLSGDPDFAYRTDDDHLLRYLRYRKFKTKETYKVIRNIYKTRKQCPELFRMLPNLEKIMDSNIITAMPYRDDDGDLLFVLKCGQWNPSEMSVCELSQLFCILSGFFTMNPHAQISGVKGIWDFSDANFSHYAALLHPANLRLWTMAVQELYPWRISRVIPIRCNPLVYAGFATVRFFLKKKIAERITLLGSDLSKLYGYVHPAVLPKEFGGNLEDDECFAYLKTPVLANLRYLEQEHPSSDIPTL